MQADIESRDALLSQVADYYGRALAEHGATPRGVDWNDAASQTLRFQQLQQLFADANDFSVADIGCGYGALLDYLDAQGLRSEYIGTDVADSMVAMARSLHAGRAQARFLQGARPDSRVDYVVASGIFNVRGGIDDATWLQYVHRTLTDMHADCRKGFAFNCLTARCDRERRRADLYYADPAAMLDHCLSYSRYVALQHDYRLYEFTVIVRRELL